MKRPSKPKAPRRTKRGARLELEVELIQDLNVFHLAPKARAKKLAQAKVDLDAIRRLGEPSEIGAKGWPDRVRSFMRPIADDNRHCYAALCARVLSSPEAVAHPQWPKLVTEVAHATQSHEDLLREYCEATGVKFSRRMLDDELPETINCMMSDERRYTIDVVVNVLATQAAVAHPSWERLVRDVCETKRRCLSYMSYGDDEIVALIAKPYVKQHPAFKRVVDLARKAFPYAAPFHAASTVEGTGLARGRRRGARR